MKEKLDYLYAFEAAFHAKCREAGIGFGSAQGMWCNAHMSHGNGESVEIGVDKWFAHVKKYV